VFLNPCQGHGKDGEGVHHVLTEEEARWNSMLEMWDFLVSMWCICSFIGRMELARSSMLERGAANREYRRKLVELNKMRDGI